MVMASEPLLASIANCNIVLGRSCTLHSWLAFGVKNILDKTKG